MACPDFRNLYRLILKNALIGRFFISLLTFFWLGSAFAVSALPESCFTQQYDEQVTVKKVIDGDTVILTDERHIRLVGIDTPEINHENLSKSEDGALKARDELESIIAGNSHLNLVYDKEKFDRHGRTLAHLFLVNGNNIQAQLLSGGFALPLTITPNIKFLTCYKLSSNYAKDSHTGLWASPHFLSRNTRSLTGKEKGKFLINGKVVRIGESRSSLWINLENNFAIRIERRDLVYFDNKFLQNLIDANIEALGWIYRQNNQLRMQLHHPDSIWQFD